MENLKVSSKSDPNLVSGAIINVIKKVGKVEIHTIGAGALNQAIKAIAIARGHIMSNGLDLRCKPCFFEIDINGILKTGIKLLVEVEQVKQIYL